MNTFGMYTNDGEIALAQKLNEVLETMPYGLTADERYGFIAKALLADNNFCSKHGEWQDTVVRETVYAWLDEPVIIKATEARATVVVEFSFPVDVITLDGNARSVLENKNDEIQDILDDAVSDAFSRIEEKIGRIAGEWSGISVRII